MRYATPIAIKTWRMSRKPFIAYLCGVAACVAIFAMTNSAVAWIGAALGLLASPLPLSMRLSDAGLNPLIVLPIFVGLLLATYLFIGVAANMGGTPGYGQPDILNKIAEITVIATFCLLGLLTLYGLTARSKFPTIPNEVPS